MNSVLPVCEGWEDHLWARVNSLLETTIDQELVDAHSSGEGSFYPKPTMGENEQRKDIRIELENIFDVMAKKGRAGVAGETAAAFHDAQRGLILGEVSEMIQNAAAGLEGFEGGEE